MAGTNHSWSPSLAGTSWNWMPFTQREIWESCQGLPRIVIFHLHFSHFSPSRQTSFSIIILTASFSLSSHPCCRSNGILLGSSQRYLWTPTKQHAEPCAPSSTPEESWGQKQGEFYLSCQGITRSLGLRKNGEGFIQYGPNGSEIGWFFQTQW